jgi:hypothetical protein
MNDDLLKKLADDELAQLVLHAQREIALRTRKRKEDTIAKIKELAGAAGVSVSIKGTRGRPPTREGNTKPVRMIREK